MKSIRTLPLIAALVCCALRAQELPTATPEAAGLAPDRIQRIGEIVQKSIDDKRIAGAVTMVVRHGKVAWLKSQGYADKESNVPMTDDTIFRICSMTKPITTTAVMMLYEEGKFSLEEPISKYLPEFKSPKVLVVPKDGKPYTIPATREIMIVDLLRHTSGITYNWNASIGPYYKAAHVSAGLDNYDGTLAENIRALASSPLLFNPGERWEYSLSIDVLGRLVEVVSGMSLDEFFKKRIFEPLGMKDTCFYVTAEQQKRLAAVYSYYDDKGLSRFPATPIVENNGAFAYSADYPYNGPRKLYSGGGGLCSTARDYARFCQMILNGGSLGSVRILSRKSVELMTHDRLGKIDPDRGFGLGFGVEGVKAPQLELGSPGQYGWGGFYFTKFTIDPKEDMIVLSFAQLHPTGDIWLEGQVETMAYQAIQD